VRHPGILMRVCSSLRSSAVRLATTTLRPSARMNIWGSGIRVERVMTNNGSGYVARLFRRALRCSPSATSAQGPTRRIPTARPSAASRPSSGNGPMPSPSGHPTPELPTFKDGSPGIISIDLTLASADDHRSRPSPEQPDRIPQVSSRALLRGNGALRELHRTARSHTEGGYGATCGARGVKQG
jgi:hypothetical protein